MRFSVRHAVGGFLPALAIAFFAYSASVDSGQGGTPETVHVPAHASKHALTISIDSSSPARAGARYELQPKVTDSDNGSLTFSADNLPPWVRIDPASGKIIGTPQTTDVGEHEAIVISVADAGHHVATVTFSIRVIGTGQGVATIEWQRPLSKVDGSILDDLAGYRISYGRDPDELDHSIFISDPAQTAYEFSTLDSGIWYFAVTSVNANGLEGPSSVPARKVI